VADISIKATAYDVLGTGADAGPGGADRAEYDRLARAIARKRCLECGSEPQIAWINGRHTLRCSCYPKAPVLAAGIDRGKERYGKQLETQLARAQATDNRQLATLTKREVKELLCPLATDIEIEIFLRFCAAERLNPFMGEVYPIKYAADAKMAIVIGYQFFLKRAGRNPNYAGYEAGVIVEDSAKRVEFRDGTFLFPGDVLRGGWCKVAVTGRATPKHTVNLSEFFRGGNQRKNNWDSMPATMIQKVAVSQAHRLAVPEEYAPLGGEIEVRMAGLDGEPEPPGAQLTPPAHGPDWNGPAAATGRVLDAELTKPLSEVPSPVLHTADDLFAVCSVEYKMASGRVMKLLGDRAGQLVTLQSIVAQYGSYDAAFAVVKAEMEKA
jgi:phage recombination protein Bet